MNENKDALTPEQISDQLKAEQEQEYWGRMYYFNTDQYGNCWDDDCSYIGDTPVPLGFNDD